MNYTKELILTSFNHFKAFYNGYEAALTAMLLLNFKDELFSWNIMIDMIIESNPSLDKEFVIEFFNKLEDSLVQILKETDDSDTRSCEEYLTYHYNFIRKAFGYES